MQIERILIHRPWPTQAPDLEAGLQLKKRAHVSSSVHVAVQHVALEQIAIPIVGRSTPTQTVVAFVPNPELSSHRQVAAWPEGHALDRIPQIAVCGVWIARRRLPCLLVDAVAQVRVVLLVAEQAVPFGCRLWFALPRRGSRRHERHHPEECDPLYRARRCCASDSHGSTIAPAARNGQQL